MLRALSTLAALICAHLHFTYATKISTVAFAGHGAQENLDNKEPIDVYTIPAGECDTHFGFDKVDCHENPYPHLGVYQLKVDVSDENQVDIKISDPIEDVWVKRHYCLTPAEVRFTKKCLYTGFDNSVLKGQ